MTLELLRRKFTIQEYHQMLDSGIIAMDERIELLKGEIIAMSPIGIKHAACVRRLNNILSQHLQGEAIIDIQNPLELDNLSEPQPDVALLKPRADFYATAHPQSKDIFLIIEVADKTVKSDREVKIPLYAENQIAEVWLVDINGESIEVYREPRNNKYQTVFYFRRGQTLSPLVFSRVNIAVNDILG